MKSLLIAIDQLAKTILLGGNPDTTISDWCWRHREANPRAAWWRVRIDGLFMLITGEEYHCRKSFEGDEQE